MECEQVRRVISDGDRRVLRGRKLSGHLRDCPGCRDFQVAISERGADLRALAPPMPGVAATTMLARLLAHGVGSGHAGGLAAGAGAAVGNSAAASLTVKALAGVATVTVAVAGGAHFALLHGQHEHPRSAARRDARLTPPWLASASTRVDASQGASASSVAWSGRGSLTAALGATEAPSVHDKASPSASPGVPSISDDHPNTGHGPSGTQRGHGKATAEGRGVPHRSHGGKTWSHRSGSSRPAHGGSRKRKRAPVQPVKQPKPRHGQAQEGTGRPVARTPSAPSAGPEEADTPAQKHDAHSGSSQVDSRAEGRAPSSTVAPDHAHAG